MIRGFFNLIFYIHSTSLKAFKATQTSNPPVFMKPEIQERNIKNIDLVFMKPEIDHISNIHETRDIKNIYLVFMKPGISRTYI